MLMSLYFPVTCNPSRAVTSRNIGFPHRVTYPYCLHQSWAISHSFCEDRVLDGPASGKRAPRASAFQYCNPMGGLIGGGRTRTSPAPTVQGYLNHKKPPPPPRTAIGRYAYAYCRVLGGGVFL